MSENSLVTQDDTPLQNVEDVSQRPTLLPLTDIRERPDAFVLVADLPGVDQESLSVSLEKGLITINGRRRYPNPGDAYELGWDEIRDADFHRHFRVPDEIDAENIDASLSHGVLTLTLPKAQAVSRRIEVKAS